MARNRARWVWCAAAVDEEQVGGQKRDADDREVREHLDEAARVREEGTPERGRWARVLAARPLLQVAEEAGELDEDDERDQHPDRGDAGVREHVVGERGRAEQRREQGQGGDRLLLGEAVVDEPVRGVVGAALSDGPALERPPNRHERRVEDRDREHEQRQHDAGQRRAGGRPARRERERGEPEADHLAAGVAHEDARAAAGPQVEGKEAEAGAAERERDHERELARVLVEGGDREDGTGDGRERRGQPVHVVEQVEGVRDPDEPDEPDDRREQVVADDLDGQPRGEDERRPPRTGPRASRSASGCRRRRRSRRRRGSRSRRGCRAARCSRRWRRPRSRRRHLRRGRGRCRRRRRRVSSAACQRSPDGSATSRRADAGTQQHVERQRRDRGRGDRGDRVHGRTG